jgi:hypothetical protein
VCCLCNLSGKAFTSAIQEDSSREASAVYGLLSSRSRITGADVDALSAEPPRIFCNQKLDPPLLRRG